MTDKQPKNLAEALLEFQKMSVVAKKDGKNPHFKSNYATLEAVIEAATQATKFGLCFTQEVDFEFHGETGMTFIRTVLMHAPSGESRESRTPIRSKDPTDDGNAASVAPKRPVQTIKPNNNVAVGEF